MHGGESRSETYKTENAKETTLYVSSHLHDANRDRMADQSVPEECIAKTAVDVI